MVNRVDMGTADKVCAAALAIHDQANRLTCPEHDVRLSCSSSAAPSRRRSQSSTEESWTVSVEPRDRSAFARPARSMAKWHFSLAQCRSVLLFNWRRSHDRRRAAERFGRSPAAATTDSFRLAWDAYVESAVESRGDTRCVGSSDA